MSSKKVLLAHDWLAGFRGGERVLESFCELYPEAPIYTLLHAKGSTSPLIESKTIHTSFLNSIPGIASHYRKFLPFMPLAAENLKLEEADVVLSSSHCVIKGAPKPPGSRHVSYVHSPMRYMYDQYDNYFGPTTSLAMRTGGRFFRNYLVNWDKRSNRNVDLMIANSNFVRDRIRKFYGSDAEVIYPFVELADFTSAQSTRLSKQDYFVMVTAFAPNKRVDLAIRAFNEMKLPLKIIGGGQLNSELRQMAGPTIEFLGNVSRLEVIETLAAARALIFPGVEDFGITPLEALASGTPVIAFKAGGVLETLTEEDTVFFDEPSVESLKEALRRFETTALKPSWDRLQKFSRPRFLEEISSAVDSLRTN
ncbi:MAG: glycosyltransferase family 4 protein [Proteobacteria bacterium]|nr:MAG: glycosyltransferase family 4 protein [Pseudomonadota bacterium]